MPQKKQYNSEMQLFDQDGNRLYLTAEERKRFLEAAKEEEPENRMFCYLVHFTGCRPTEALELTAERVLIKEQEIVFRTIKKRKLDNYGNLKKPKYRHIPVPENLIDSLDFAFRIRQRQKKVSDARKPLWEMSRPTAWRLVKRVMDRGGVSGKQATTKGLRHGFGIAMLAGDRPMPLNILRDLMGHAESKTTEIYLQAVGKEKRKLVMQAWES